MVVVIQPSPAVTAAVAVAAVAMTVVDTSNNEQLPPTTRTTAIMHTLCNVCQPPCMYEKEMCKAQ